MRKFKVSFAGAGKVASALCRELSDSGHTVIQISSRSESNGRELAKIYNAGWSGDLTFSSDSEIIIVAVPDSALPMVLKKINCGKDTIVAHTAGSVGLEFFQSNIKKSGVFYPLQTFSGTRRPPISSVPFFIEGSDSYCTSQLRELAMSLSSSVFLSNAADRRFLHLAAVFVSNFTNHMFTAGKEISSLSGVSFDVLKPLIEETVAKALEQGPEKSQTGPAARNDINTIEKHLDLLSYSPYLKNIYEVITKSITSYYNKKGEHDQL